MEKILKDTTMSLMRKQSWWVLATHEPLRQGVPDLACICNGRAVWIELKRFRGSAEPGDEITLSHELTAPQSKMLRDQHSAGAIAGVLVGYDEQMCTFISAGDLYPGPLKKFKAREVLTHEEFIEWIKERV